MAIFHSDNHVQERQRRPRSCTFIPRDLNPFPWLFTTIALCVTVVPDQAPASELQFQFFDGLRTRQLFSLAERYCHQELARKDLPATQRIDLSFELARTYTVHATFAPVEEQPDLWSRADQILDQSRLALPDHPRLILLNLQSGLQQCARGQAEFWKVQLNPENAAFKTLTEDFLQSGIASLTELEPQLRERLHKPGPKVASPEDSLLPVEIRHWLAACHFELGVALLTRAKLLSESSPDRFPLIEQAEKWFLVIQSSDRSEDWKRISLIKLATCARLRADPRGALRLLKDLETDFVSPDLADQVLGERARILLYQGEGVEAAEILTKALKDRPQGPGELLCLRIQVLIALSDLSVKKNAPALTAELEASLDQQLQALQSTHPGYWSSYGQLLITRAREARLYGPELSKLVGRARDSYGRKKFAEAAATYQSATELAVKTGKADLAFDLKYIQGSIELEAGRFDRAQEAFQQLLEQSPDHSRTPDASYLRIYALSQTYSVTPTKETREAYTLAMERHRQHYPRHTTFGEVTWLLAQLQEKRLQNSVAIKLYREIPIEHTRAAAATQACAGCYEKLLRRLREKQQPTQVWETEAINWLSTRLPDVSNSVLLDDKQSALALHLANIILLTAVPDYPLADKWLEAISRNANSYLEKLASQNHNAQANSDSPADSQQRSRWEELKNTSLKLRILSLAGQEHWPAAETILAQIGDKNPAELLQVLDGLSRMGPSPPTNSRHSIGELRLQAALRLKPHREQLNAIDRLRLDRCLAEAYASTGRITEAIEHYRSLLSARPGDLSILRALSDLFLNKAKPPRGEESLILWKQLESQSKPGTEVWFEARYQVAAGEYAIGRTEPARKLILLTKVLYPKLGGPILQHQFEELLKKCQPASPKP